MTVRTADGASSFPWLRLASSALLIAFPLLAHSAERPVFAPSLPIDLQPTLAQMPRVGGPLMAAAPGTKKPAATRIEIPLRIERLSLGEVAAYISPSEDLLAFDGSAFLKALGRHVIAGGLEALRGRIGAGGRLTVDDLRAVGLAVTYDASKVEAAIDIPLEMRTTQSLSLSHPDERDQKDLLPPSDVSGYVNFLGGHDFVPDRQGATPIIVDFDGALNLFGNVIEGVGTYRDIGVARWARGDTRLVRDDPETRTRVSVGDISYSQSGFQSSRRAGGIAIARNFGLQPYRSSSPVGETDLNLDRNARVDVIVNGQRMRTLDLAPGRYNVRDLPMVGGTNDVTLRIVDEVGRVDVIRFPFVFDSTVLAEGEQDFSYAAGVGSESTNAGRRYDIEDRIVSAFHTYGLTNQLTVGGNAQATRAVKMVGSEARLATGFGTFRVDGAASLASFASIGGAARLQYRFSEQPSQDSQGRYIAATGTYRSPGFASIAQTIAGNPIALSLGALYGQRISGSLYGSLGVSHQFARTGQPSVTTVDGSISLQIAPDMTASVSLSTKQAEYGQSDSRMFFSFSWFPFDSGQRYASSYDTVARARQFDWSYTPSTRIDSVQADVSIGRNAHQSTLDGLASYTGYRFSSRISNATTGGRAEGDGGTTRTRVNFGTALAFAGGHVGVSRPITDSFAMFVPHPTLSGQTIEINRVGDTSAAMTDFLGAAVMPELNSYYEHHVAIDAADLPLGYDLGRQLYDLRPTYRSGTVIAVGTGAVVLGDGMLVDQTGKPLPLELGRIESIDDGSLAPVEFFTSRAGRFRVEGLATGRFRMTLANEPGTSIEFAIPEGRVGRVDLGTLIFPIEP